MSATPTLRHAGILVANLEKARQIYQKMGFRPLEVETIRVLKMTDAKGQMIELVEGAWHPHIAVNWFDDGDGNYIELVREGECISLQK